MSILRNFIAALVSIGLVLAPVTAANAMVAAPAGLMDRSASTAPHSMNEGCLCCDMAAGCAAAACGMSCAQLGPASDAPDPAPIWGHAAVSGSVPLTLHGLSHRPPTPPPRV